MATGITAINEEILQESVIVDSIREEIEKAIVAQKFLIDRLLIGILANGDLPLDEGTSTSIDDVRKGALGSHSDKIPVPQFSPDLFPADSIGTFSEPIITLLSH